MEIYDGEILMSIFSFFLLFNNDFIIYRVAQNKVSHYRESSLNRTKNRQPG